LTGEKSAKVYFLFENADASAVGNESSAVVEGTGKFSDAAVRSRGGLVDIRGALQAVFLDDKYVGHASEFGGLGDMLISPGKHRIKVGLPGYRTFETEVNLLAGQKFEVKTELVKGSIKQASSDIKRPLVASTV
jgi:hypothetical protein